MINSWIIPASITLFCWGIWSFIPKLTTRYISPVSAIFYEAIGASIMGLIALSITGFRPDTNIKGAFFAIATGIVGIGGALGFLFAIRSGKVSVVSMFVSMSPIITLTLAYFILKEPVSVKEILGISCAFMALFFFTI